MSFLAIEGCHAFVTGAQGGIGRTIVKELHGTSNILSTEHWLTCKQPTDVKSQLTT